MQAACARGGARGFWLTVQPPGAGTRAPARSPRPHLLTLPGVRGQEASRAHLLQLELQCKRNKGVQACLVALAAPGEERGQQPLRVARAPKHGSHVKAARSD